MHFLHPPWWTWTCVLCPCNGRFGGISDYLTVPFPIRQCVPSLYVYRRDAYFTTITQLAESSDVTEFQDLMTSHEYHFRFSCGITKPTNWIPFSEKHNVVNAMCLHYSILVSLAELEQLRRGLAI